VQLLPAVLGTSWSVVDTLRLISHVFVTMENPAWIWMRMMITMVMMSILNNYYFIE
jgi:hypothetical protein